VAHRTNELDQPATPGASTVSPPPPTSTAAAGSAAERAARARALVAEAQQRATDQKDRRGRDRARDLALVERAKDGDTAAFRSLVELHQRKAFAVAVGILHDRDEAMDVVQDAFIKVHKKLGDFEANAAFSTWLHRIVVNLCIDRKRAVARRRQTALDDVDVGNLDDDPLFAGHELAPRLSGTNPLRNAGDKELGQQLQQALAELSDDHRAIVLLREVEGLSYEELSETLGIPCGTVMSRLFHARKRLQKALRPLLGLDEGMGLDNRPVVEGRRADDAEPGRRRADGETAGSAGGREDDGGGARRTRAASASPKEFP
jgi:RNA polymerase sigma-70 factor (ECF subfamily)